MRVEMMINGVLIGASLYSLGSVLILLYVPTMWQIAIASSVSGILGFVCPKVMRAILNLVTCPSPW